MKKIPLNKGKFALVDDKDYETLSVYKWYITPAGYASRHQTKEEYGKNPRKTVFMHRYIAEARKGEITDHVNGNPLDNRRENLRVCTTQQNIFNRPKLSKTGTSKYKGVMLRPYSRWEANIKVNGKGRYLGVFDTEKEAAHAYNIKAKELFGEFALLNRV